MIIARKAWRGLWIIKSFRKPETRNMKPETSNQ